MSLKLSTEQEKLLVATVRRLGTETTIHQGTSTSAKHVAKLRQLYEALLKEGMAVGDVERCLSALPSPPTLPDALDWCCLHLDEHALPRSLQGQGLGHVRTAAEMEVSAKSSQARVALVRPVQPEAPSASAPVAAAAREAAPDGWGTPLPGGAQCRSGEVAAGHVAPDGAVASASRVRTAESDADRDAESAARWLKQRARQLENLDEESEELTDELGIIDLSELDEVDVATILLRKAKELQGLEATAEPGLVKDGALDAMAERDIRRLRHHVMQLQPLLVAYQDERRKRQRKGAKGTKGSKAPAKGADEMPAVAAEALALVDPQRYGHLTRMQEQKAAATRPSRTRRGAGAALGLSGQRVPPPAAATASGPSAGRTAAGEEGNDADAGAFTLFDEEDESRIPVSMAPERVPAAAAPGAEPRICAEAPAMAASAEPPSEAPAGVEEEEADNDERRASEMELEGAPPAVEAPWGASAPAEDSPASARHVSTSVGAAAPATAAMAAPSTASMSAGTSSARRKRGGGKKSSGAKSVPLSKEDILARYATTSSAKKATATAVHPPPGDLAAAAPPETGRQRSTGLPAGAPSVDDGSQPCAASAGPSISSKKAKVANRREQRKASSAAAATVASAALDEAAPLPPRDEEAYNLRGLEGKLKTPKQMLQEWIDKHGLPKAKFELVSGSPRFRSRLRIGDRWWELPPAETHGNLSFFGDGTTAQHAVATRALYDLSGNVPLYHSMHPAYRAMWQHWRAVDLRMERANREMLESQRETFLRQYTAAPSSGARAAAASGPQEGKPEALVEGDVVAEARVAFLPPDAQQSVDEALLAEQEASSSDPGLDAMRQTREHLPACRQRAELLQLLDDGHRVVLISGATGSGKTTQIPQYILEHEIAQGRGSACSIICTQPRRIAAISVAERVSAERGEEGPGQPGALVGYQVRLEAARTDATRLLFCTTGVLLRMLCAGDGPVRASVVVVDEVHERDVQTDLLLVLLKLLMPKCPHLRVILMSATMSVELFAGYFGGCPVVGIEGRTFPVTVHYLEDILTATGHQIQAGSPCALRAAPGATNSTTVTVTGAGGAQHAHQVQWEEEAMAVVSESWEEGRYDHLEPAVQASLKRCDEERINYDLIEVRGRWRRAPLWPVPRAPCPASRALIARRPWPARGRCGPQDLIVWIDEHHSSKGAVLVFLPGMSEIQTLFDSLSATRAFAKGDRLWVLPLHSTLSSADQAAVFRRAPPGARKVVLTTNIAETSLTVDDVEFVVDTGRVKETAYDKRKRMITLQECWVAAQNMRQRCGRAGRVCPGHAFLLYTKHRAQLLFKPQRVPEIQRLPLEEVVLQLKVCAWTGGRVRGRAAHASPSLAPSLTASAVAPGQACAALSDHFSRGAGVADLLAAAVEPPTVAAVDSAVQNLIELGAVRDGGGEELTPLGHHLAALPVDARLGKMILFGAIFKTLDPILCIAASLSYKSPLVQPFGQREQARLAHKRFWESHRSDHLAVWEAYKEWNSTSQSQGARAVSKWCDRNFVSGSTMRMLGEMMRNFRDLLVAAGFVRRAPKGNPAERQRVIAAANAHAGNAGLVRAVLCAGLYPNIVHVQHPTPGGTPKLLEKTGGEVLIHPASGSHRSPAFDSEWLVFHDKVKTSRVFVRDCSAVPLPAVLLFALHVEIQHAKGMVVVDRWMHIRANPRTAVLLKTLRMQLNALLEVKMSDRQRRSARSAQVISADASGEHAVPAFMRSSEEQAAIIDNIASLLAEPPKDSGGAGAEAKHTSQPRRDPSAVGSMAPPEAGVGPTPSDE